MSKRIVVVVGDRVETDNNKLAPGDIVVREEACSGSMKSVAYMVGEATSEGFKAMKLADGTLTVIPKQGLSGKYLDAKIDFHHLHAAEDVPHGRYFISADFTDGDVYQSHAGGAWSTQQQEAVVMQTGTPVILLPFELENPFSVPSSKSTARKEEKKPTAKPAPSNKPKRSKGKTESASVQPKEDSKDAVEDGSTDKDDAGKPAAGK